MSVGVILLLYLLSRTTVIAFPLYPLVYIVSGFQPPALLHMGSIPRSGPYLKPDIGWLVLQAL